MEGSNTRRGEIHGGEQYKEGRNTRREGIQGGEEYKERRKTRMGGIQGAEKYKEERIQEGEESGADYRFLPGGGKILQQRAKRAKIFSAPTCKIVGPSV